LLIPSQIVAIYRYCPRGYTIMAIDLSEELIPLTRVPALHFVPRRRHGKKLNQTTVFRWANPGVRGVRLETIRFGGTLCTTQSALLEFFRRLTPGSDMPSSPPLRTPGQRQRAHGRSDKRVTAAGM
jgi:hypothetical protein